MNIKSVFSKDSFHTKSSKAGSYSLVVIAVVLAIVIALNIFVSALPSNWTQLDISSSKLYSISSNTKVVVNHLTKDVTIYWITQAGEEDEVIEKLLGKYDAISDYLTVEKKNPDIYPTFAQQYTDDTVQNNDIVVVCGDRYRYISYDEIYESDTSSYYSTGNVSYAFDGEGEITSAIDYVISEDLPKVYMLSGHGEAELSDSISNSIAKENIETYSFSLLTTDAVPEDADCVLINSPASDISEKELEILEAYLDNGGKMIVFSGLTQDVTLTNLNQLAAYYGLIMQEGIVIESDSDYYAFSMPWILMPSMESSEITDPLIEESYRCLLPISGGFTIDENADTSEISTLLVTSDSAFAKLDGYNIETYEKEDGDVEGQFILGACVTKETGDDTMKLVWITSNYFLDDTYNSYSSGANLNLTMNSFNYMFGETENISIRAKSIGYEYLTISDTQASRIKTVLLIVVPAAFLAVGIYTVIQRRKLR